MSRLGYHLPNFTYPGSDPARLFDIVVAQATEAESSGFDRLTLMDHFYQLPQLGRHDEPMMECYTMLGALAQRTNTIQLSAMVTGNTYRNPMLLAKEVTTLDHVSGGRATLGIGAGWYQLEHDAFGIEFGTFTDRFEKLEEALQIIVPMLRGETVSFAGKHYQATDAVNSPAPLSPIPIMIGGSGEKKTLRMVAQYADESNFVGIRTTAEVMHKLDVLAGHCETLNRDRSEITVTVTLGCCIAPTMEQAVDDLRVMGHAKGWNDEVINMARSSLVFGDPDTVGEQLASFAETGIDGLGLSLAANGHIPGRLTLLGEIATKALS